MATKTVWVLAADSSRARVLQVASREKLAEVASFDHSAGHVGEYLEKARAERRYDQLVVIAPRQLLGALRKELGGEVGKLVAGEAAKDLSMLSQDEREGYFSRDGRAL
jgi:protein required for attachment to host cells